MAEASSNFHLHHVWPPRGQSEEIKSHKDSPSFKVGQLTLNVTAIKINVWLIYVFTERHLAWDYEGV